MAFAISLIILGFVGVACFSAILAIFSFVFGGIMSIAMTIRGIYLGIRGVSSFFVGDKKCNNLRV